MKPAAITSGRKRTSNERKQADESALAGLPVRNHGGP
jgi:hypothetical protein